MFECIKCNNATRRSTLRRLIDILLHHWAPNICVSFGRVWSTRFIALYVGIIKKRLMNERAKRSKFLENNVCVHKYIIYAYYYTFYTIYTSYSLNWQHWLSPELPLYCFWNTNNWILDTGTNFLIIIKINLPGLTMAMDI